MPWHFPHKTMKKIPDNAKKVFEGFIFDVYHWEQVMFDGSKETFEAIKRIDSVTVLAVVDDKILINSETQPGREQFFALPGGRINRDENPNDAIKRELLEETGYSSEDLTEWFKLDASDFAKIEWPLHYFIAKNCIKKKEVELDPGEKIETKLITLDELIELRNKFGNRNIGLKEKLEKASQDESEKQKLKEILFAKN